MVQRLAQPAVGLAAGHHGNQHGGEYACRLHRRAQGAALADLLGQLSDAGADMQVGRGIAGGIKGCHQRHAALHQCRQGSGKLGGIHALHQPPGQPAGRQKPVKALAIWLLPQPEGQAQPRQHGKNRCDGPGAADPGTDPDQNAGQERQGGTARGEDLDDVGHHKDHQHGDNAQADHAQKHRIQQCQQHRLSVARAVFDKTRQMAQYLVQPPGLFAGLDRGAVIFRKAGGMVGQSVGQCAALGQGGADVQDYRCDLGRLAPGDGVQRLFDPQAGAGERRQLPRHQRQAAQ